MAYDFTGKRIVVTGAGQGIGKGLVHSLVQAGAKVVAVSKTQANLDKLAAELPGVETIAVDLGDWDATRHALSGIGPVDGLVNNAAVSIGESFLEMTRDGLEQFDLVVIENVSGVLRTDFGLSAHCAGLTVSLHEEGALGGWIYTRTFAVNFFGLLNVSQVIGKGMVERNKGGTIVNISSQASQVALKDHTSYGASKAAVDHACKSMALELGKHNIRVNCVNPTVVLTAMAHEWLNPAKGGPMLARIPLGRFSEVQEVVDAVMFLLSDKSTMINGVTLPVDGGFLAT